MRSSHFLAVLLFGTWLASPVEAGLYYSGETFAELPSQWRGFLLDQRALRTIAIKPTGTQTANPGRVLYEKALAALDKTIGERKLTADEQADLGALYVRLGEYTKAVDVLRAAQRVHPGHFRIVANLGTAWQMAGDLDQAVVALTEAVRLSPGKLLRAEEAHLKLVRQRQKEKKGAQSLDDLFGVRWVSESGKYVPSQLAEAERKKLPGEAMAIVQQLALWLPADGRLLWQLAELANAAGDVRTAASMMDGCVGEFLLRDPELREHRQLVREAADALAKSATPTKIDHENHPGAFKPRSLRPLLSKLDQTPLPDISAKGVNPLPWQVVTETTLDKKYRPTFASYLKELDGKQVTLTGYMQMLGDNLEQTVFLFIEYPVGCWYCETPDVTGILRVEMAEGKSLELTRGQLRVTGKLKLNSTDPENFLYTIKDAEAKAID